MPPRISHVLGADYGPTLRRFIAPENLPTDYGGTGAALPPVDWDRVPDTRPEGPTGMWLARDVAAPAATAGSGR